MAQITIPALGLRADTETGEISGPPGSGLWPALIQWLIETTGMSSTSLARRLDVNDRTVRRWMAGDYPPLPRERRLLLAFAREVLPMGGESPRRDVGPGDPAGEEHQAPARDRNQPEPPA